jgi:type VI secretion system protein ImpA
VGGETVPSQTGLQQGVAEALSEMPELASHMEAAHAAVAGISGVLEKHLEASQTPDLGELRKLLQRVADSARMATGAAGAESAAATPSGAASAATRGIGAIASREDAIRALGKACEWIETNEPSHPAPLLIRRAQRLLSMDFLEIIKDIAPDGLSQIERLAGTANT